MKSFLRVLVTFACATHLGANLAGQQSTRYVDHPAIPGRCDHAMAYDAARERVVVFTGSETWEWNGVGWLLRQPATSPPSRSFADMAYDPATQRIVLFGGEGANGLLADTWSWDGVNWQQHSPAASPSPRMAHCMAYDHAGARVLLFGGWTHWGWTNPHTPLVDTWAWDGTNWQLLTTSAAPQIFAPPAMVSDAVRQRIVLHGADLSLASTTWEWSGLDWVQLQPVHEPAVAELARHGLAYDAARQRVVLYGADAGFAPTPQTWEWDGVDWVLAPTSSSPPAFHWSRLCFDGARDEVIAFGGGGWSSISYQRPVPLNPAETWTWDGQSWQQRSRSAGGASGVLVTDTARNRVVAFESIFLGYTNVNSGTVWEFAVSEWDGSRWHTTPVLSSQFSGAAVFDSVRATTTVYGVEQLFRPARRTFEWDGVHWTSVAASPPNAELGHAMAFDAQRGMTVLFGGGQDFGPPIHTVWSNETWLWDGVQWTNATTSNAPAARGHCAMAYDPVRGRIVMHGGTDYTPVTMPNGGPLADTWEWDGSQWTPILTNTSTPAVAGHAMAWDPTRQCMTAYIGNELWDYNGLDWTLRTSATAVPTANAGTMTFDPKRGAMMVRGGFVTRWLGDVTVPTVTLLGNGCGGTLSPRLTAPLPHVGDEGYAVSLDDAPAGAPVLFALAAPSAPLSLGSGCTWWLGTTPFPILPVGSSNSAGHADLFAPIPNDFFLRGLDLHLQAVAFDTQASPIGLLVSSAQLLHLGD